LTSVCAIILYFVVSGFPEDAEWMSEEERAFLKARLQEDVEDSGLNELSTVRDVMKTIFDYKVILGSMMHFGLVVPAYVLVFFGPSFISNLGYDTIHAQLLSIPPLACGFVSGTTIAFISDYYSHRFLFAVVCCLVSITGFDILLTAHNNPNLQYGAILVASLGTFPAISIVFCWFSMNGEIFTQVIHTSLTIYSAR